MNANKPLMIVEKVPHSVKPKGRQAGVFEVSQTFKVQLSPVYWLGGRRHLGGIACPDYFGDLFGLIYGTREPEPRGKVKCTIARTRGRIAKLGIGTDQSVVVMKSRTTRDGAKGLAYSVLSIFLTRKRMIEFEKTKSLPLTKEMVWEACLQVRRKGKSAGVDE